MGWITWIALAAVVGAFQKGGALDWSRLMSTDESREAGADERGL